MKIVHIALCGPVTDNLTYQDNLLPKYHRKIGNEVVMITSNFIYDQSGKIVKDSRNEYFNENLIKTVRLEPKNRQKFENKFKKFKFLYSTLKNEKPDVLFIHGVQFRDITTIVRYLKKNPVKQVYVDNHADFSNSATNWISLNILHKIIWRYYSKKIIPFVDKFYGVLPSRVTFLNEIYKIPLNKIELLLMGVDTELLEKIKSDEINILNNLRNKYSVSDNDFIIVTGGKIDKSKTEIFKLIEAVKKISLNIKLIIFGSVDSEFQSSFISEIDGDKIIYTDWLNPEETYSLFLLANLVVFPGRHSVLWEQAVGCGVPGLYKKWYGTEHVNINNNAIILEKVTKEEIIETLKFIVNNKNVYANLKLNSQIAAKYFSYEEIAKMSLGILPESRSKDG